MKLGKMLLTVTLFIILTFGLVQSADRLVVTELVTNLNCGSCYLCSNALDTIYNNINNTFISIRYHSPFPFEDIFYTYNPQENSNRLNFYNITFAPYFLIDGFVVSSTIDTWQSLIENRSLIDSPFIISLSCVYDPVLLQAEVNVEIFAESETDPESDMLKLRIALIEDIIMWPNILHQQTFRDMIPSADGENIAIEMGQTLNFSYNFNLTTTLIPENLTLVAFIQDDGTREILQGARTNLIESSSDVNNPYVELPKEVGLFPNYPNPFNAETKIDFYSAGGYTKLEIYDIKGSLIKTLVNESLSEGLQSVNWNGTDNNGQIISSGMYFYKLYNEGTTDIKKMTLLK